MSSKYQIRDHQSLHFITFATVEWVDALSRPLYKDIVIESLKYCTEHKGMILYAYVIMSNHIHLIASAKEGYNLSDIVRDFKKHTSKSILKEIENNRQESRKKWMLWLFRAAGESNKNNTKYQLWRQDNRPIELSTNEMIDQRLDYIHNNPVAERIVDEAEHYVYSSASNYSGGVALLAVELIC